MRDPYTMIFEWPKYGTRADRLLGGTLFSIWHRDENGVDGACGWSYPHLTDGQLKRIRDWAWCEGRDPYFLRCPAKFFNGSRSEAECLYRALVLETARCLDIRISIDEATRWAITRVHRGGCEDGSKLFCFVPGYHTTNPEDTAKRREHHFAQIMAGIARELLARRRPWYRHPRWHVHHWSVRVYPVIRLWRWLFDRCSRCGGRFRSTDQVSGNFDGTVRYHTDCEAAGGKHG